MADRQGVFPVSSRRICPSRAILSTWTRKGTEIDVKQESIIIILQNRMQFSCHFFHIVVDVNVDSGCCNCDVQTSMLTDRKTAMQYMMLKILWDSHTILYRV